VNWCFLPISIQYETGKFRIIARTDSRIASCSGVKSRSKGLSYSAGLSADGVI